MLVIAPHPDDEVLGCGGTIIKYVKQGHQVFVCFVTKAYTPDWSKDFLEKRKVEIEKSSKILGLERKYFLDYPTAKLDTIPQKELIASINKVISDCQPQVLYIPHKGDLHKDHKLVFEASLVASRFFSNNGIKKILSYETLSETESNGQAEDFFMPNVYEGISKFFGQKLKAISSYSSELKKMPHPRSLAAVEALARKRGFDCGAELAESFMLIKEIN